MLRLMNLAVYPARVLKVPPFPSKGWLPKAKRLKERAYLFPHEEAASLVCIDVPLAWRLLFGFCVRGSKASKAISVSGRQTTHFNTTLAACESLWAGNTI